MTLGKKGKWWRTQSKSKANHITVYVIITKQYWRETKILYLANTNFLQEINTSIQNENTFEHHFTEDLC